MPPIFVLLSMICRNLPGVILFTLSFLFLMCSHPPSKNPNQQFLDDLLSSDTLLSRFAAQKDRYRIQIIYSRINRDHANRPRLEDFSFNLNPQQYFYPASCIKMPLAFLAAQKCERLGIPLDASMLTDSTLNNPSIPAELPRSSGEAPSVASHIRNIFMVSDNDASNKLYDFLGQDEIHEQLRKVGCDQAEIIHRLAIPLTEEQNRRTNPVQFYDGSGKLLYSQPEHITARVYPDRSDWIGKGYMNEGKLIHAPMDFSKKNRFALEELHRVLQLVIMPECFAANQRFQLQDSVYKFLYRSMSMLPRESINPVYEPKEYYDSYVKFFLFGTRKETRIPDYIRIFNKVGWAYGFLTDVAYIVDFKNQVEFFLSATIYCNEDEILNDDQYDYEQVGLPFLERLGELVYNYELNRKKTHLPDLSRYQPAH